jgi:hypothetical protein
METRRPPLDPKKTFTGPLGPLGFNFSQHGPTTRPSVERTAEKAFMLYGGGLPNGSNVSQRIAFGIRPLLDVRYTF